MNSTAGKVVLAVIGFFLAIWLLKAVVGVALAFIFNVVVPIALVAGIAYVGYLVFSRKALGGGRRTLP
jgi:hypothetical protein